LRLAATVAVLGVVAVLFVVPELRQADWSRLARIDTPWLVAGGVLEALSLFSYSLLTRSLLPPGAPGLSTVFRIDSSCTALGHVVPAGSAASAALGYRLFTRNGVKPADVCFTMASQGPGSSVVLNLMLWVALLASIPFTGFDHLYLGAVTVGGAVLVAVAFFVHVFAVREEHAVRVARAVASRVPRVRADAAEGMVRSLSSSVRSLRSDPGRLRRVLLWASVNWILDAASLWCFVAALGHHANPVVLFCAFGIANVAAAIPLTPSGLGVIEVVLPLLLAGNGITKGVATLAVIGWRLVSFWLPIPFGAGAYLTLVVPRPTFAGRRASGGSRYAVGPP
ncbi:MAG: lysylphosphatidylglycerol synthase transmembrane domain-containing protein, partial [Acidimicrobiales bacterium]